MIAKDAENKVVGHQVENSVSHNSPIGPADCAFIVPEIDPIDASAGSTAQQRMGDRIKPKSLKVKGVLSWAPDDCNTLQNIYARVMILSQKDIKVGTTIAAGGVDTSHLLRPALPGADQTAFKGDTADLNYSVNSDKFKVFMDKTIKLTCSNVGLGGREAMPLYSARWSYTFKSLPSNFSFDAGNGDWVNNFAPFLAIGYAYSDGTAPDTITTKLVSNVYSKLEFEDS